MLSNLHGTVLNCMHRLGYLPHKGLCCTSYYAGTPRQELLVAQGFLNASILS